MARRGERADQTRKDRPPEATRREEEKDVSNLPSQLRIDADRSVPLKRSERTKRYVL